MYLEKAKLTISATDILHDLLRMEIQYLINEKEFNQLRDDLCTIHDTLKLNVLVRAEPEKAIALIRRMSAMFDGSFIGIYKAQGQKAGE